jgi:hypothetical protein
MKGMVAETKGPGANAPEDNGLRIEQGRYPLATQAGTKYVTWNYVINDNWDVLPKPALELTNTGDRTEILIHPGNGFLRSVGCINLCTSLPDASEPVDFAPSRTRVIAMIEDLKAYLGAAFPATNGREIPRAFVVIDGEP